jgi:peptidoglycan/xylan/chitin deacetylase (PgdA/CDA1 family)
MGPARRLALVAAVVLAGCGTAAEVSVAPATVPPARVADPSPGAGIVVSATTAPPTAPSTAVEAPTTAAPSTTTPTPTPAPTAAPPTSAAVPPTPATDAGAVDWPGAGQVALTFDDGPDTATPTVAGLLEARGIHGTFFEVGANVARLPDVSRMLAEHGHSVQDHTWSHPSLDRLRRSAVTSQLARTADAIATATGHRPTCFRPPYGRTNAGVAAAGTALGLAQRLWTVDTNDYQDQMSPPEIVDRALASADGRPLVILFHDGGLDRSRTVAALPAVLDGLVARGYRFVTLCPG